MASGPVYIGIYTHTHTRVYSFTYNYRKILRASLTLITKFTSRLEFDPATANVSPAPLYHDRSSDMRACGFEIERSSFR